MAPEWLARKGTSRSVWAFLTCITLMTAVTDSPIEPVPDESSNALYTSGRFDILILDKTALLPFAMLPFEGIQELKSDSSGRSNLSHSEAAAYVFPGLALLVLVTLVCLIMYQVEWALSCVSSLNGENALLKNTAAAALHMHKAEVIALLSKQHTHLLRLAKSCKNHTRKQLSMKQRVALKKLKGCLKKQGKQVSKLRRQQAQQAQQAQHVAKVQQGMCTVGLDCCYKLDQLGQEVKECSMQHLELKPQVRANTQARDLLCRLSGIVDELRTQLQVAAGTQDAVCRLASEVKQQKQHLSNITSSQQQLQQQIRTAAELRYESKVSADEHKTRTTSLETNHALMKQSLQTQHQSVGPRRLNTPQHKSRRLSAVAEDGVSQTGTTAPLGYIAPLSLEAAHNLRGAPPDQGRGKSPSAPTHAAGVHGRPIKRRGTQESVRQPRLSDFQDVQGARHRSQSMQQNPPWPLPSGQQLRKSISFPPGNFSAKTLDKFSPVPSPLRRSFDDPSNQEGNNRSGPAALRARDCLEQANSGGNSHSEGQHEAACPLERGIAALQGNAVKGTNKPSPFEVASRKAGGVVKASPPPVAPAPMRVIDQVRPPPLGADRGGSPRPKQTSLRAAAMLGNLQQQGLGTAPLGHHGMLPLYQAPKEQRLPAPDAVRKAAVSPFATYKGNKPAAPASDPPHRVHSLPVQAQGSPLQPPPPAPNISQGFGVGPKHESPNVTVQGPAKGPIHGPTHGPSSLQPIHALSLPQPSVHDQTGSSVSMHNNSQAACEPKPSLFRRMGEASTAFVKSLKKEP